MTTSLFSTIPSSRKNPEFAETLTVTVTSRNKDAAIATSKEGFETVLPVSEDMPEQFAQVGDEVVVIVTDVIDTMVIVSRTSADLPGRLLGGVVPEISAGSVRIMGAVRDPGHRTKLAVAATELDIDPVAACVGRSGGRISRVVELLNGERVEVIPWDQNREKYLANALAPARVNNVTISSKNEAIVYTDTHLMAATVGEAGQNAMLAGDLVGVRVHVEAGSPPVDVVPDDVK